MKLIPLFALLLLVSCDPASRSNRDSFTSLIQKSEDKLVADKNGNAAEFKSVSVTHMNPKVKIDIDRQEIEVLGGSGAGCGIDFQEGQILRYFLDANELELDLVLETEVLRLKRVHMLKNEKGIYGDWQYISFDETKENHRERIITLFIRDEEIMNVDVYCEYK